MNTAGDRAALHRLIDTLRMEDVATAQRVLEALNASRDPLLAALSHAPDDDEGESPEEREAVERARRDVREGRTLPQDEITQKLRRA